MFPFSANKKGWSSFFGNHQELTRKQALIEKCRRRDVSIYIDDAAESSSGIYGELRGVVSEAELEKRLNSKLALNKSKLSNIIAITSLVISLLSLLFTFYLNGVF